MQSKEGVGQVTERCKLRDDPRDAFFVPLLLLVLNRF